VAATVQPNLMKETTLLILMKMRIVRTLSKTQVAQILHLSYPHILEEKMIVLKCNIFKISQLKEMKSAKSALGGRRESMIGKFLSLKFLLMLRLVRRLFNQ
jgi:hypothetical protein